MKAGQLAASIRAWASQMIMQTDVSATERQHLCVDVTAVPVLDAYSSQRQDLATLMNPFGGTTSQWHFSRVLANCIPFTGQWSQPDRRLCHCGQTGVM